EPAAELMGPMIREAKRAYSRAHFPSLACRFVSARDHGSSDTCGGLCSLRISLLPSVPRDKRRASIIAFFQRPAPMWDQLIRLFRELPETSKLFILLVLIAWIIGYTV